MSRAARHQLARDYGRDVLSAEDARRHFRDVVTSRPPLATPATYEYAVRRELRALGRRIAECAENRLLRRLIRVGWRRIAPRLMAEQIDAWAAYVAATGYIPENAAVAITSDGRGAYDAPRPEWGWEGVKAHHEVLARLWRAYTLGLSPSVCRVVTLPYREVAHNPALTSGGRRKRMAAAAKALNRASAIAASFPIGADLLRACAKLSPEGQQAAIASAEAAVRAAWEGRAGEPWAPAPSLRVVHVDWSAVQRVEAQCGNERARVAYALRSTARAYGEIPRRALAIMGLTGQYEREISWWLAPAYKTSDQQAMPARLAERLFLGESPLSIAGGLLSKAEAHAWLMDGAPAMAPWLQARLIADERIPQLRSVHVVRWVAELLRRGSQGLFRDRTIHGPAGQVLRVRLVDKIDEIQDEDLINGLKTSLDSAFERAGRRLSDAQTSDDVPLAPVPQWRVYRHGRWLLTANALRLEGKTMGHCVGGYTSSTRSRQSACLSLTIHGHRSTVEMSPEGIVFQHRGPWNKDPHPDLVRLLDAILKRNRGRPLWAFPK